MEDIEKMIMTARPHLRPITIKNYMKQLNVMSMELDGGLLDHLGWAIDIDKVLDYINSLKFNVGNTYLSTLIVGLTAETRTPEIDDLVARYREVFKERKMKTRELSNIRTKTPKEKENWTTIKKLKDIQEKLGLQVQANHIADKAGLTTKNHRLLQRYLIASLYALQPTRRYIYADTKLMPLKDFNKLRMKELQANFLVFSPKFKKLFFWFGLQKSKLYADGQKIVPSLALKKVIRLYLYHNYHKKYLLYDNRGNQMTRDGLSKQVFNIFNIRVGMIRKIWISEKTKNFHSKIEKLAIQMGHSPQTAKDYYLKD